MKQQNRVQLSFTSILKIFGIYALALNLFFTIMFLLFSLMGIETPTPSNFIVSMIVSPFLFVLFAVFGYPFFALFNRVRGGLLLKVVRGSVKNVN